MGDLLLTGGNDIYEKLYNDLLEKRIIYLNSDIDDSTIDFVTMQIIMMNEREKHIVESKLEPLTIYLNSYGGSADVCLHLIQVIEESRIPINCRVLAIAASAGLYITLACKHRVGSKNSVFLLHKGSIQLSGNIGDAEDTMHFYKEIVGQKFDDLIIRKTNIDVDTLKEIRRNETYCLGEEALEYGFIDELI